MARRRSDVRSVGKRPRTIESMWGLPKRRETVVTMETPTRAADDVDNAASGIGTTRSLAPGSVDCVDLFCGCGGWSTGAVEAGHRVVLAIDMDDTALCVHRRNHPHTAHVRMTLGPGTEATVEALVRRYAPRASGRPLHVHGSPPCQAFSAMRNVTTGRDTIDGMALVEWYVEFVRRLRPDSWSFEQVGIPAVRTFLTAQNVRFEVFNFLSLGVPQTRRRVLAGTPALIDGLVCAPRWIVDKAALAPSHVLRESMPAHARYVRASGGKKPPAERTVQLEDGTWYNPVAHWAKSVDRPTWTLLCAVKPVWLCERYETIRVFTVRELATLQTLPADFDFPCTEAEAVALIGNCVPPLVARLLMERRCRTP